MTRALKMIDIIRKLWPSSLEICIVDYLDIALNEVMVELVSHTLLSTRQDRL